MAGGSAVILLQGLGSIADPLQLYARRAGQALNLAGKPHPLEQIRNMAETQVSFLATDGVWIYQPSSRCILRVAKCNGLNS